MDLCGVLNGTSQNILLNYLMNEIKDSMPLGFFHPCPYSGSTKAFNVSTNPPPEATMFLQGFYRAIYRFYDGIDDNIFTATCETETVRASGSI
jgi:hypothetical protein